MRSIELQRALAPFLFTQRILWAALTFSIVIYVVVAWFATQQAPAEGTSLDPVFIGVFGAVSVAVAVASFVVPPRLLTDAMITAIVKGDGLPAGRHRRVPGYGPDGKPGPAIDALSQAERRLYSVVLRSFTPTILRLALHESIAVFGLLLALMSGTFDIALPFAIAAIALNVVAFPRPEPLLERAERLQRGY